MVSTMHSLYERVISDFFDFEDPETRNILTYPNIVRIFLFRSSKKFNGAEGSAKIFRFFGSRNPKYFDLPEDFEYLFVPKLEKV